MASHSADTAVHTDNGNGNHDMKMLNLVFLGEKQTGKTLLVNRFLRETSKDEKFKVKVDAPHRTLIVEQANLQINLINTSGKEKCRSTITHYIRDSSVFLVLYDITDKQTFDATSKWVDIIRSEHGEDSVIILVGNKSELADHRVVSPGDGERLAKNLKTAFIETSAVAGPNLKILFRKLIEAAQELDLDLPYGHNVLLLYPPHEEDHNACSTM